MHGPSATAERPRIGRYVVEEKLGEGGMAETWLALVDGIPDHYVVIKTIMPERRTPQYETMFVDEARIGSRLLHPNIPRVIEFGRTAGGTPFMVQEFVDGPSVLELIVGHKPHGPFDLGLACRIALDIATALDFAHTATDEHGTPLQVVHRDVSPTNILVSKEGVAKLIDFGVARFSDRTTETQTGILKGKLPFMPPEAILQGAATHQGDLYALGIVLYRMCTGRMPTHVARAGAYGGFERPSARRPDVDPELERIVLRCVNTDRSHRYATGAELCGDLTAWFERRGGVMPDHEVTQRLFALFGDPNEPPSSGTQISEPTWSPDRAPPTPDAPPRRSRRPRGVGWMVAGVVSVGLTLGIAGAVLATLALTRPLPSFLGLTAESPDERVARLLDEAAGQLARSAIDDAEATLSEARDLPVTDGTLAGRRTAMLAEADLLRRVIRIEARSLVDLDDARAQALDLREEHPGSAVVTELLGTLEARHRARERRKEQQ